MQLHREDVLEGAMRVLDAEGLDRVTMRRLGEALDVRPSALYWHFRNKRVLLDAMAERLMRDFGELDPSQSGLEQLADWAGRYRAALLSHRDGARVVSGTFVHEPFTLRIGTLAIRAAIASGVDPAEAGMVAFSLQYYVLGQTIEEQSYAEIDADHQPAEAHFPEFSEAAAAVESWKGRSVDERFAFGVRLFLDGVRSRSV